MGRGRSSIDSLQALGRLSRALAEQAREARERERQARQERALAQREARLLQTELQDVTPLRASPRAAVERPAPSTAPLQRQRDEKAVLAESLSDGIGLDDYLDTDASLSWHRIGIGPDVVRRLRRGEWTVRRQIDLHGLRVDEARAALVTFLNEAVRDHARCVRIIHGKGLGSANREPVLKGKVRRWLMQRDEILAFSEARPNDGGAGAVIVLLRTQARER